MIEYPGTEQKVFQHIMSGRNEHMILIVASDRKWCAQLSAEIMRHGYKTVLAHTRDQALEVISQLHPDVIIHDDIPAEEAVSDVISHAQNQTIPIPTIIISDDSPADTIENKNGIFAYVNRSATVEQILNAARETLHRITAQPESGYLQNFSDFFHKISRLNASHDIEAILDLSFDYFMKISAADYAAVHLLNSEPQSWNKVRETGTCSNESHAFLLTLREKVVATGTPLLEVHSTGIPSETPEEKMSSFMAVPLMTAAELRGVILFERSSTKPVFMNATLQALEIVAVQIGNAFINVNLYDSVNRKLQELQIISNYSEKLMGLVDKYDVIKLLCETAIRYFDIDFMACLIVKRRTHEFLSWSRYATDEEVLKEFCNETIGVFDNATGAVPRRRRIKYDTIPVDNSTTSALPLPALSFKHTIPLCWEDLQFGAVLLGTVNEPEHTSNKLALLSSMIGQTRIALTNTRLYSDMKENYIRTIKALAIAVDAKDTYTHGHSENVMNIAEEIARELSISEKDIGIIRDAGLLHDIGKIGIPGYILNKPGPLTYEEFNGIMKTHSTLGANIVRDVPFLRDLYKLILHHHEHYDGKGYPDGLRGEQIPIGARILHVADAFEAMTSNRPYRKSLGRAEALHRLSEESGRQFDPAIISAFLRIADRKNWLDPDAHDTTMIQTSKLP